MKEFIEIRRMQEKHTEWWQGRTTGDAILSRQIPHDGSALGLVSLLSLKKQRTDFRYRDVDARSMRRGTVSVEVGTFSTSCTRSCSCGVRGPFWSRRRKSSVLNAAVSHSDGSSTRSTRLFSVETESGRRTK